MGAPQSDDFDQLLLNELDSLYRTAKYLTGNPALAEDLVQDTALKALNARHTFRANQSFRPWVFAILRNNLRDHYRRQGKHPDLLSLELQNEDFAHFDGSRDTLPDERVFQYVLDEEIEFALQALPEAMRFAVLLADVEQLSYQDIAQLMGWPMGTVMSRLSRGRHKLRSSLSAFAQRRGYTR